MGWWTPGRLYFLLLSAAHWYHSHWFFKIVWFCIRAPPITFTTTSSMLPLTNCILSIVLFFGNNKVVLSHSLLHQGFWLGSHSSVDVDGGKDEFTLCPCLRTRRSASPTLTKLLYLCPYLGVRRSSIRVHALALDSRGFRTRRLCPCPRRWRGRCPAPHPRRGSGGPEWGR